MLSMTGFGRATYEDDNVQIWMEVKSYNSKNLDIYVNLPVELSSYETFLRKFVIEKFSRGKFELRLGMNSSSFSMELRPSAIQPLQKLVTQLTNIGLDLHINMRDLQHLGFLEEIDATVFQQPITDVLVQALDLLMEFRRIEGERHSDSIKKELTSIRRAVNVLEDRKDEVAIHTKKRLNEALEQYNLHNLVHEQRFMEEVSYYLVKSSIKEEIVRLKSHIEAIDLLVSAKDPVGRRLDFLAQEIHREANTISSKSEDIEIKQASLIIKEAIDSIREQGRNIE